MDEVYGLGQFEMERWHVKLKNGDKPEHGTQLTYSCQQAN